MKNIRNTATTKYIRINTRIMLIGLFVAMFELSLLLSIAIIFFPDFTTFIKENSLKLAAGCIVVTLFFTFFNFCIGIATTHGIRSSINDFIKKAKLVAEGNYNVDSFSSRFSEFSDLSEKFAQMKQRISRRENALEESEKRFKDIARNLPVGVIINDTDGNPVYFNSKFAHMFGLNEYAPADDQSDYIKLPDSYKLIRNSIVYRADVKRFCAEPDKIHPPREYKILRSDGSITFAELSLSVYEGMTYNVFADISDRKKAEEEIIVLNLELEQKVLERTREYEQANIQLESANKNLKDANTELERMLNQLRMAQDQLLQSEKMALLGQLAAGIAHEVNTPLGAIISANDHQVRTITKIASVLPDFLASLKRDEYRFFLNILYKSKNSRDDLQYRERREIRQSLAEQLAGGAEDPSAIADDLIDIGIISDIEPYIENLSGKKAHEILKMVASLKNIALSADIIMQAADKAAKVVGALKTYSHTQTDKQMEPEDITKSIDTVLTLYYNTTKTGTRIVKRYEPVPPVMCFSDRLSQVWINIINNAFHAMDYRGTLEIWVRQEGEDIIVSITDDGAGIPHEIQGKVFQPFFTTKKSGEGTGLGLDIVKKIVESHGGTVSFSSEPGNTTFTVRLKPGTTPENPAENQEQ